MVGNEPLAQQAGEAAGALAPAAPSGTSACRGAGCSGDGSDTRPASAAATSFGCGGCTPPAGGPAKALRHVWKCVGMVVVMLLTLRALKTAAARSRAA
jgi:hypothetical protein